MIYVQHFSVFGSYKVPLQFNKGLGVMLGVRVGVLVIVGVIECVGVIVGVLVLVGVILEVGVMLGVLLGVGGIDLLGVTVGVLLGVGGTDLLGVRVGVTVLVGVMVGVGVGDAGGQQLLISVLFTTTVRSLVAVIVPQLTVSTFQFKVSKYVAATEGPHPKLKFGTVATALPVNAMAVDVPLSITTPFFSNVQSTYALSGVSPSQQESKFATSVERVFNTISPPEQTFVILSK